MQTRPGKTPERFTSRDVQGLGDGDSTSFSSAAQRHQRKLGTIRTKSKTDARATGSPSAAGAESDSFRRISKIQDDIKRKQEEVQHMLSGSKERLTKQQKLLSQLQETNKYFYKQSSPSPYMIAEFQYLKR